ncbi:MAG: hypothetical protein IPG22_07465 [Acidobacteria bacterium]|nr:hypothetical protein [Acidobacteriota bacterium]
MDPVVRQQQEIESLRQQLDHIKEVDFPRKVEAVSNGWRTRLDAERIVAKERFEKLLSWVDDYCEVDDKDFIEIEPVVNAVLGEAIETNPLSDLRQQLSAAQARIDELMLEYCPEEMTNEQIAEYEKHQRPAWRNFSLELKKEQK